MCVCVCVCVMFVCAGAVIHTCSMFSHVCESLSMVSVTSCVSVSVHSLSVLLLSFATSPQFLQTLIHLVEWQPIRFSVGLLHWYQLYRCTCTNIIVHAHTHARTRMHTHTRTHTRTHTHTHIHTQALLNYHCICIFRSLQHCMTWSTS